MQVFEYCCTCFDRLPSNRTSYCASNNTILFTYSGQCTTLMQNKLDQAFCHYAVGYIASYLMVILILICRYAHGQKIHTNVASFMDAP